MEIEKNRSMEYRTLKCQNCRFNFFLISVYCFRFENSGSLVASGRAVVVRCLMRHGMKPLPVTIPASISEHMKAYQLSAQ